MIDLEVIRKAIVSELNNHMGIPVIMLEQKADKPNLPFVGYKFTMPMSVESPGIETQKDLEQDIEKTLTTNPKMTLSITTYADDADESFALAAEVYAWFDFIGRDYLTENHMVVRSMGSIENRDTLIADDYERRHGFDVTLITEQSVSKVIQSIESVEINDRKVGE